MIKQKKKVINLDLMKIKREQIPKFLDCYDGLCDLSQVYEEIVNSIEYHAVKQLDDDPVFKKEVEDIIQFYELFKRLHQFLEVELDELKDLVNSLKN